MLGCSGFALLLEVSTSLQKYWHRHKNFYFSNLSSIIFYHKEIIPLILKLTPSYPKSPPNYKSTDGLKKSLVSCSENYTNSNQPQTLSDQSKISDLLHLLGFMCQKPKPKFE